ALGTVSTLAASRQFTRGVGDHRAGGALSCVLHAKLHGAGRFAGRRTYLLGSSRLYRGPPMEAGRLVLAGGFGERDRDPGSAGALWLATGWILDSQELEKESEKELDENLLRGNSSARRPALALAISLAPSFAADGLVCLPSLTNRL